MLMVTDKWSLVPHRHEFESQSGPHKFQCNQAVIWKVQAHAFRLPLSLYLEKVSNAPGCCCHIHVAQRKKSFRLTYMTISRRPFRNPLENSSNVCPVEPPQESNTSRVKVIIAWHSTVKIVILFPVRQCWIRIRVRQLKWMKKWLHTFNKALSPDLRSSIYLF